MKPVTLFDIWKQATREERSSSIWINNKTQQRAADMDLTRKQARAAGPMKAIIHCEYGSPDVLKFEDVEKPVPNDNQVLIKVRAASLNPVDGHLMRAPFPLRLMTGLRKPKKTLLGADVAGQVEAVGRNVKQFKPGDEVFGAARPGPCGVCMCSRASIGH